MMRLIIGKYCYMTPEQEKDMAMQYHMWKNQFNGFTRIKMSFTLFFSNDYDSAFEYFMVNEYKPR